MASNTGVLHRDSFAKNAAVFFEKSRSWRKRSTSRCKRTSSSLGGRCRADFRPGDEGFAASRRLPAPGKISCTEASSADAAICLLHTRSRSGPTCNSSLTRWRRVPLLQPLAQQLHRFHLEFWRESPPSIASLNHGHLLLRKYLRCPPNRGNFIYLFNSSFRVCPRESAVTAVSISI